MHYKWEMYTEIKQKQIYIPENSLSLFKSNCTVLILRRLPVTAGRILGLSYYYISNKIILDIWKEDKKIMCYSTEWEKSYKKIII